MELEKPVKLGQLLDIYGSLLTSKQQDILAMYVNENMSYQEIATVFDISKPAVLDSIKIAEKKLYELESKLKVLEFRQKLQTICETSTNPKQDLAMLLKEV